jgi:hypothetical protein
MSATTSGRLELPQSLQDQLRRFRDRVWWVKTIEALGGACCGFLTAYVAVFALDRLGDTPFAVRAMIFLLAMLACALVPMTLHRWVWRHRRLEQLARLLSQRFPSIGDQLLGVIELVRSESEQARSRDLCEAAIRQVAEAAGRRDMSEAIPRPAHRRRLLYAATSLVAVAGLAIAFPDAAENAWSRFITPWRATPRYTFTQIVPIPQTLVVAHGESFVLPVQLADGTKRHPTHAQARIGQHPVVSAESSDGRFQLTLPGQLEETVLDLTVGDFRQQIRIQPKMRPELVSLVAQVELPSYLQRPGAQQKDVRGGSISILRGSSATFVATASRDLVEARVDGEDRAPQGATVASRDTPIESSRKVEFQWKDAYGLAGKEPFSLGINQRDDEPPSLGCEDLPRQKVVLDTELLKFKVHAQDDFGIKRIGVEWQGLDATTVKTPAKGERILAAGGGDKETLGISGTFSAESLGIEPQPIQLRLFAEDYLPDRERVYSPTYTLYVLNAEQHAIWLTEQLSKWHRMSLEVRDKELQLYETNRELRELTERELAKPENQRRLDAQAAAERANGRRLSNLVNAGEDLVQQAMRNPEFGVGHLEKWAEMLQILKDISGNRMPSVAELLKQSAQLAANSPSANARTVGQNRGPTGSPTKDNESNAKNDPNNAAATPRIVDVESSQQPLDPKESPAAPKGKSSPSGLRLPTTMLAGGVKGGDACPATDTLDQAITQQQDLLSEFDKISDELNRVLANLEGSTLVKRLKAASRLQYKIGGRLADQIDAVFGTGVANADESTTRLFGELSKQEAKSSHDISVIMDDLQAYFERRHFTRFKTVLDDMRKLDVIAGLRQIADDLHQENGLSISQCEYWSDNMDRWAEDLVDPASGGT